MNENGSKSADDPVPRVDKSLRTTEDSNSRSKPCPNSVQVCTDEAEKTNDQVPADSYPEPAVISKCGEEDRLGERENKPESTEHLHVGKYNQSGEDMNTDSGGAGVGEDSTTPEMWTGQGNREAQGPGCEPASSPCDSESTVDGDNLQAQSCVVSEHAVTGPVSASSHNQQSAVVSDQLSESDPATNVSNNVSPNPPSVSTSGQHTSVAFPEQTVPEVQNVDSLPSAHSPGLSLTPVNSVSPSDQNQDVQLDDMSPPLGHHQADQCVPANQENAVQFTDHIDACEGGDDSQGDKDTKHGVNDQVVCDSNQERHVLPQQGVKGEDNVTGSILQPVDGDAPSETLTAPLSGVSQVVEKPESGKHVDTLVTNPSCPEVSVDPPVTGPAQSQTTAVSPVETTAAVPGSSQPSPCPEGSPGVDDTSQLGQVMKAVNGSADSVQDSGLNVVTELSQTSPADSCCQEAESGLGGGLCAGDTRVPTPASSSASVAAVSDSPVPQPHSQSGAQTPDRDSCDQGLDTCPCTVQTPKSIESLQDAADFTAKTGADQSRAEGSPDVEVTSTKPQPSLGELASAHNTHQSAVSKSPDMADESAKCGVVVGSGQAESDSPLTVTSPQHHGNMCTNMASEDDGGSSVDPEPTAKEEDVGTQKVEEGEEEDSESSEDQFEDVTANLTDDRQRRLDSGEGQREEDPVTSYSDEASDGEDDFFDAFDEQEGETDPPNSQDTDRSNASDLPTDAESRSTTVGTADPSTSDLDYKKTSRNENATQADDPSVPSSCTSSAEAGGALRSQHPNRAGRRRSCIPDKPHISLSLWGVLKNCIGKELSKIPMPVNFNEPLSMLQRLTEELEYSEILDRAAQCEDPSEQLAYVAAFTVSSYATTQFRTAKPFNPLLGETFEFDRTEDLGWRSLAEQVSHHPPALATHVEGRGWTLWQEFTMTIKFRGRYIQIIPRGMAHLKFTATGHHYTWRKVTTTVHNIIVGRLWVDNEGQMDILNHCTGHVCHLKYHPYSYFSRQPHRKVTGLVKDRHDVPHWTLTGTWCTLIEAAPVLHTPTQEEGEEEGEEKEKEEEEESPTLCYSSSSSSSSSRDNPESLTTGPSKVLWRARPLPEGAEKTYHFSQLAVEMNEPEEGVAPTDSRRRPDQRRMEEGDWEEANQLKFLLEEKQREARRRRAAEAERAKAQGEEVPEYQPVWFQKQTDPITGTPLHVFNGHYWKCKETQQWDRCPDIFL